MYFLIDYFTLYSSPVKAGVVLKNGINTKLNYAFFSFKQYTFVKQFEEHIKNHARLDRRKCQNKS